MDRKKNRWMVGWKMDGYKNRWMVGWIKIYGKN